MQTELISVEISTDDFVETFNRQPANDAEFKIFTGYCQNALQLDHIDNIFQEVKKEMFF